MADMIVKSPDEVVAFLKAQHNLIEDMFDQVGSVPGSGVSDGGVSVPDVRGPSRESLW